jgi:heme/copper-type cytochrome/quinol oxidase subunit 1
MISSFGSLVSVVAVLLFAYVVYDVFAAGRVVKANPWAEPSFFTSTKEFNDNSLVSNSLE